MPSELRVKCFWDEPTPSFDSSRAQSLSVKQSGGTQGFTTTGDRKQVLASLAEFVNQLQNDPNDYVVKVFVHRRMDIPEAPAPVRAPNVERKASWPTWDRERTRTRVAARQAQMLAAPAEREHHKAQAARAGG